MMHTSDICAGYGFFFRSQIGTDGWRSPSNLLYWGSPDMERVSGLTKDYVWKRISSGITQTSREVPIATRYSLSV